MKNTMMRVAFFISLFIFSIPLLAQSPADLKSKLNRAKTPQEKMLIQLELGKAFWGRDNRLAGNHARKAYNLAEAIKDNGIAAESAYLLAQTYNVSDDNRSEERWLNTAFDFAQKAGNNDIVLKSIEAKSKLYFHNC